MAKTDDNKALVQRYIEEVFNERSLSQRLPAIVDRPVANDTAGHGREKATSIVAACRSSILARTLGNRICPLRWHTSE